MFSGVTTQWRSRIAGPATLPVAAAMVAGAFVMSGTAQAATPPAQPLSGTHPAWATAAAARGATPAGTTVSTQVYLAGRNPAGLAAFAAAVSDPASPEYQHYLTAAQQQAEFGPTQAQLSAVDTWLTGAGLKITASTEQYVTVSGTASAIGKAFSTQLRNYALSGHVYYAPGAEASVPASIGSAVLGVSGLTNAPRAERPASVPTTAVVPGTTRAKSPYIGPLPCSTYWAQKTPAHLPKAYGHANPDPVCGYTPNQLRDAYGVASTPFTGKHVTVAVVDAYGSSTILRDTDTFDRYNKFPEFAKGQFSQILTPADWTNESACGGPAGWLPEESLDVQSVHTMAPGAHVLYVGANSCLDSDFLAAFANIVDHHLASIVTNSWDEDLYESTGNEPIAAIRAYTRAFEEGATEGIGFYFASGDCSTDAPSIVKNGLNCDINSTEPQVTFPASDPWVTAVGASAIGIGAHNNYLFETGMGDDQANLVKGRTWSHLPGPFLFGAGGGTSNYFTQPHYQAAVVPSALAHTLLTHQHSAKAMRVVPDVAMEGDLFAATMVGFTQQLPNGSTGFGEAGFGGTSVATPLFAGVQADAQQAQHSLVGFANPEIYLRDRRLGKTVFRDITDHPGGQTFATAINGGTSGGVLHGQLFTLGKDYTLVARRGYDNVTGVGSPTAGYIESFRHKI